MASAAATRTSGGEHQSQYEATPVEIAAAGAPNYTGRSLHSQVKIDHQTGLMYIHADDSQTPSFRRQEPSTRTVSVPVKTLALAEQGQEEYHVRDSDNRERLELTVGSDVCRIEWRHCRYGIRKDWLVIPAKEVRYVKVTVNRWQHGKEGSDVFVAMVVNIGYAPKLFVLMLEIDTVHQDIYIIPPKNEEPYQLEMFDPNVFEHMKVFFESWQQKNYCRTEIDRARALAVPLPGQSFSSRPPIPEGYDPHDSSTWVAPFGPVSAEQEALYTEDAARKEADAVAATAAGSEPTAPPTGQDTLPVVITQSGRTVKARVVHPPGSTTDTDKEAAAAAAAGRKKSKPPKRARKRTSSGSPAVAGPSKRAVPSTGAVAAVAKPASGGRMPVNSHETGRATQQQQQERPAKPKPTPRRTGNDETGSAKPRKRVKANAVGGSPRTGTTTAAAAATTTAEEQQQLDVAASWLLGLTQSYSHSTPDLGPSSTASTSTSTSARAFAPTRSPYRNAQPAIATATAQKQDSSSSSSPQEVSPPEATGGPASESSSDHRPRRRRTSNRPAHMQDYEIYPGARKGRQKFAEVTEDGVRMYEMSSTAMANLARTGGGEGSASTVAAGSESQSGES
ncbi:hypothetical protein JCM10908_005294 [Rhodotorula pacifica]|uniref:uncharacterized protein n=1 Tax=Rhodotorula pacifica TaxID=1495444 RepID=UPI0031751E3F